MAYCTQCGAQIPDRARFCPGCGTALATDGIAQAGTSGGDRDAAPPLAADEQPARKGGFPALAILALVALVVVGVALWQQREGARPVAGSGKESAAAPDAADTPTADAGVSAATREEASTGASADQSREQAAGDAIPAARIDGDFHADRDAASQTYAGPVTVQGVVTSTERVGPGPSVSIAGRTPFNYVIVNFDGGEGDAVDLLRTGMSIRVRCSEAKGLAGTTILNGCTL